MKEIFSVKGMHDILPNDVSCWAFIEKEWTKLIKSYCYREIRFPLVEKKDLFYSSIGSETDIISKELFVFQDKSEKTELSLRPEGTASCARAVINNNLIYKDTQKVWYMGNMFRHENTQKGRYRQFSQIGIEAFGFSDSFIEIEQISIINRFLKKIGLEDITLEINSIGSNITRTRYTEALKKFLSQYKSDLNENAKKQLKYNPLRILDSKDRKIQDILSTAPQLTSFYTLKETDNINRIEDFLKLQKIRYIKNKYLVRGLDYYNDFVFEFTSSHLGAQSAICAGGRYDKLIKNISNNKYDLPCFGCALGVERLVLLMKKKNIEEEKIDLFFISIGESERKRAFMISELIRNNIIDIKILFHLGNESIKKQIKKAKRKNVKYICILSNEEYKMKEILVKSTKFPNEDVKISSENIINFFKKKISNED